MGKEGGRQRGGEGGAEDEQERRKRGRRRKEAEAYSPAFVTTCRDSGLSVRFRPGG